MSRLPIPDDWSIENGYCFAWFCVPNSVQWRAIAHGSIYNLTRGRNWDERTGDVTDVQAKAIEILESLCMADCNDLITQLSRIADGIEAINTSLNTDNLIYPDLSVADILQTGLIGRQFGVTLPFEGEGLADILDDQIETLHNRFRQTDYTGLSTEKNITETLEALLRTDRLTDYEFFTPNIVTVLQGLLSVGDGLITTEFKNLISSFVTKLGLIPEINEWLQDQLDTNEYLTIADLLLLLLQTFSDSPAVSAQFAYQAKAIVAALRGLDTSTSVTLNNYNGCSCGECDDCTSKTIIVPAGSDNGLGCVEEVPAGG